MIAKYYGRQVPMEVLRNKSHYNKEGVSLLGLSDAAESIGLRSAGVKITFDELVNEMPLPAILYWGQQHYVVLTPRSSSKKLEIADPARGIITLDKTSFLKHWLSAGEESSGKGVALLLESTPEFMEMEFEETGANSPKASWYLMWGHLKKYNSSIIQIALGLLLSSVFQLIFPYLTQSIVDTGINSRNINFIQIILAAQLMLLLSQTLVEFIRNRMMLYVSVRINISLLSSFWSKLLKLPMSFFDNRHPGDIIQRIGDHHRIENFLTGPAINTVFSFINVLILSVILLHYNIFIFVIFIAGTLLYLLWIRVFLRIRRQLDYKRFAIAARENNATLQLVYGMQEIKLNNAESTFRWKWEKIQATLFNLNFKNLSLTQYQQIGAFFLNQGKNILITYLVAKLVIDGSLTLGMMLAISYIIGQLNGPVEQLIQFSQQAQDSKISLERLNDIHSLEVEEPNHKHFQHYLPNEHSISIRNLSFAYPGSSGVPVLKNINLQIPQGKVTAIVGDSGSGKSTLLKLMLGFYQEYQGEIYLGNANLKTISPRFWRSLTGTVMQESYIFNDDIRCNIVVTNEKVNNQRLLDACKIANILQFIESLPLGFSTKIGMEGVGLSGGQKQRLAIARAVYKDPQFIFFDEATNALDATNEKDIIENLQHFFDGRTVVVIAHRLSTVKNADKIIVMNNGTIVEEGTHETLANAKGAYYYLVKNQLELGN